MSKALETFLKGQIDYYNKRIIGCDGDDGNEEDLLIWKTKIETYEQILELNENNKLNLNKLKNNIMHELANYPDLIVVELRTKKISDNKHLVELYLKENGKMLINKFISDLLKNNPSIIFTTKANFSHLNDYDYKYEFITKEN